MVATDQPVLDLWRADRNAATIDDQLRERDIPAVQRAVITMLIVHPRSAVADGHRRLQISLRAAADWLRRYCESVANLTCDHSAVYKALQVWVDRGVIAVTGERRLTYWLQTERLRQWFGALPDVDDLPIFRPVAGCLDRPDETLSDAPVVDSRRLAVTGGDCCRPVLTAVDSRRLAVKGGDSHDDIDESKYSSSESSPPEPREEPARERTQAASSRSLTEALSSLPDLPVGIWSADTSDRKCVALLNAWWAEHGLQKRHGPESDQIRFALLGLICLARPKNNPLGYYETCLRLGVRPAVASTGRNYQEKHRERAYVAHG